MTAWSPVYRVRVNGHTVTDATLSGLTITSGRTDIYSQAVAGYANITLIETEESAIPYEINDPVSIEVQDSNGDYVNLFGGSLTDVIVSIRSSGAIATSQTVQIIAVGSLARLARAIFTDNLPHEYDGTRIYNLLVDILLNTWDDVPAATTWATYNPTTTWADAENVGLGEIDQPGDYELHSQTGVNDTVYNLAAFTATSGLGYLYEDAQGRIGYADSTRRAEYLSTNGYVDLDGNHAIGPNLTIAKRAGDVRNAITLSYGSNGASSTTTSDPESITLYGPLASTVSTSLRNQADAEAQAAFYLAIRAYPQFEMKQITFQIGNPEIDDADRDALLNVFMGLPLNITNLPANMVNAQFQGFVEGWTWTANLNSLSLTMTLSPLAYSLQSMKWEDVNVAETWNTIDTALDWLNATIVA
jgi:hypothetical protein